MEDEGLHLDVAPAAHLGLLDGRVDLAQARQVVRDVRLDGCPSACPPSADLVNGLRVVGEGRSQVGLVLGIEMVEELLGSGHGFIPPCSSGPSDDRLVEYRRLGKGLEQVVAPARVAVRVAELDRLQR